MALSLPPFGWRPLGLIGAGLLYWRLGGLSWRARAWSGWWAGLGCYGIGLFWARAFNWYGALVLIVLEALFMAAPAMATPSTRGRGPAFVGAFTLAEALRMTWPFGGLPIGGVFLGQADGPLLPLARLGGPLLLTAAVWAGGVGLATFVLGIDTVRLRGARLPRRDPRRPRRGRTEPGGPPCAPRTWRWCKGAGDAGSIVPRSHPPWSIGRSWRRPERSLVIAARSHVVARRRGRAHRAVGGVR